MDDLDRLLRLVRRGDRDAAREVFSLARRKGNKEAGQMAGLLLYPTETMYLRSVALPAWNNRHVKALEFVSMCLGICLDVDTVARLDILRSWANMTLEDDSPYLAKPLDVIQTLQGALAKDTHWDAPARGQTRAADGNHTRTLVLATRTNGTLTCGVSSTDALNPHPGHFWDDLNPWGWNVSNTDEFMQRLRDWADTTNNDRTTVDIL